MFNFPKIEREENLQYGQNFLRTIIFQVRYVSCDKVQSHKESIKKLFIDELPRYSESLNKGFRITASPKSGDNTPILEPIEDTSGIEMKSQDGNKVLSISVDTLTYTVSGDVYQNFKLFQSELVSLDEFFKICEIKTINRIAIRKINVIEFFTSSSSEIELAAKILHPELVGSFNYFPENKNIDQSIQSLSFQKDTYRLLLKYGLLPTQAVSHQDKKVSSVLIDIDLINSNELSVNQIIQEGKIINDEVFNVFHWTLSNESKNALS